MSYRVIYGKKKGQYSVRKSRWKKTLITIAGIIILLAVLRISGISAAIWHFFLPGDAAVTESAITGIVENIANGTSVADAFTFFCEEIIHGT